MYICIYTWYPPKTDVFEVATLWEFQWGVPYIYIHTYVCINCCLTVEPRYLEKFLDDNLFKKTCLRSLGIISLHLLMWYFEHL